MAPRPTASEATSGPAPRVGKVIEEEFGVRYHPGHVSRILKEIGWTPQVPITRAIQRDEEAIACWREHDWPQLKRIASRQGQSLVFVDESGFYLLPQVVKTYGPKGRPPVVDEWQTHNHLSIMGALTTDGRVYTLVRQQPLTGVETVEFLWHLGQQLQGPVLLVWDRSPIHRRERRGVRNGCGWGWPACGAAATVCAGPEPGGMAVASSQGGGDGQSDVPRPGRAA